MSQEYLDCLPSECIVSAALAPRHAVHDVVVGVGAQWMVMGESFVPSKKNHIVCYLCGSGWKRIVSHALLPTLGASM